MEIRTWPLHGTVEESFYCSYEWEQPEASGRVWTEPGHERWVGRGEWEREPRERVAEVPGSQRQQKLREGRQRFRLGWGENVGRNHRYWESETKKTPWYTKQAPWPLGPDTPEAPWEGDRCSPKHSKRTVRGWKNPRLFSFLEKSYKIILWNTQVRRQSHFNVFVCLPLPHCTEPGEHGTEHRRYLSSWKNFLQKQ